MLNVVDTEVYEPTLLLQDFPIQKRRGMPASIPFFKARSTWRTF